MSNTKIKIVSARLVIASLSVLAIAGVQESRAQSLGDFIGAVVSAPFHAGQAIGSALSGAYSASVFGGAPSLASDYSDGYGGGGDYGYGGGGSDGYGGGRAALPPPPPMKVLLNGKTYLPEDVPIGVQNEGASDAIQALYVERDPEGLEAMFAKNEKAYSDLQANEKQDLLKAATGHSELYCSAFCGGFDSDVTLQGKLVVKGGDSQAQIFQELHSSCAARNAHLFREYRRRKIRSGQTIQDVVDVSAQTISCHTSDQLAEMQVQQMVDQEHSSEQNLENARQFGENYMKSAEHESGQAKADPVVNSNRGEN